MKSIFTNHLRPILSFIFIILYSKYAFEFFITKVLDPPMSRDGLPFLWQVLLLFVFPIVSFIGYWVSLRINEFNSLIVSRINAIILGSANMFYVLFLDSATLLAFLCFGFCLILGLIEKEKKEYQSQKIANQQIINTDDNYKLFYKIIDNHLLLTIIATVAISIGGLILGYCICMGFLSGSMIRGFSLFGVTAKVSFFSVLKVSVLISLPLISIASLFKSYISQNYLKVALAVIITFVFLIGPGAFSLMMLYDRVLMNFLFNIMICGYLINLLWFKRDTQTTI